ncbi:MAG TPA: hypothetical protein QGF58_20675 [Myxococcota bacterium]|nr:hypothetical protein [Myxococcota bacterium]
MLLSLLFACYSTEDFSADYNDVICEKTEECYDEDVRPFADPDWTTLKDCLEERDQPTRSDDEDCPFDREFAKLCVEDMQSMPCQDYTAGTNWPESCDFVCGESEEE